MNTVGRWYYVDGVLTQMRGEHDDIVERTRELRADGHTVKAARAPVNLSPRTIAKAASHRRGR